MSEPNSEATGRVPARSDSPLGSRGLLALGCLFGGPLLFATGLAVIARVLNYFGPFALLGIVVVCAALLLIPIGERLRVDTYWSRTAVHARRASRTQQRSPGPSDVLWALFALTNSLSALFALAASIWFAVLVIPWLLAAGASPSPKGWADIGSSVAHVLIAVLGVLMIPAGIYLATALPLTIARGSWRRTIWGWREQSPDPADTSDDLERANTAKASRTALAMIFVLIALMVALTVATAYSLRDYRVF